MSGLAFLFHGNLLYAEYPLARIPEMVEKSYLPMLKALYDAPAVKAVLNFSGFTLELLAGEHPGLYEGKQELFPLLKDGVKRGQFELTGSSWGHAILPTLPAELRTHDIRLCRETIQRLIGVIPEGFFPPELAVAPFLPAELTAAGYRWTVVDRELLMYTRRGALNDFNEFMRPSRSLTALTAVAQRGGLCSKLKAMRAIGKIISREHDYSPVEWQGVGESSIVAFPLESAWIAY
ncbi:MAG TPA: hypothetical protein ENN69_02720, partial [Spirochaetia bacterium]|nr:hypothetical protein [Spirochaetia bacterium]